MRTEELERRVVGLEKFYVDVTETAKKQGYSIDFLKAEASPCKENGEPLTLLELNRIYGNDVPSDWKWRYDAFLEDENEDLQKVLRELEEKGYEIVFNFTAADALLGNLAVRIRDNWFAIGECTKDSTWLIYDTDGELHYDTNDEFELGSAEISIMKMWSPFYVLSKIKRMRLQLTWAFSISGDVKKC
jgi:hypothetical protein